MQGLVRGSHSRVLATDLDGTFLPLEGNVRNTQDLKEIAQEIKRNQLTLVFVTGRHFESVLQAIQECSLPFPDWIICDVGSSIYGRRSAGGYQLVEEYHLHQDEIVAKLPIGELRQRIDAIAGLQLQEEEKQGRFKLSFYADAERLTELADEVRSSLKQLDAPYALIQSVDPFNGDGLIDLLPADVSKAYALDWWTRHTQLDRQQVVFAGDSGNDYAALTSGTSAILVGNADRSLAQSVYEHHRAQGWSNRLFLARQSASSGVLEGMRWYGLAENRDASEAGRIGATCLGSDKTSFRVWAPRRNKVEVEITSPKGVNREELKAEEGGYFSATLEQVPPGVKYQYVLDGATKRPDPASQFQPDGVHGGSQVVDPHQFPWTDTDWAGIHKAQLIIYELHLGSFTDEGTFRAAINRLPELVELGITAIELMPVAQSPGRWNWGYDGVDLFAPRNSYGDPDDFRALVDACHACGLAVILDVVYNHLGPEGNYLSDFGPYFSADKRTPWGEAFNFDGEGAENVRSFIIGNSIYWLEEFHLDGLRLDAVHFMLDDSRPSILDDIGSAVARLQESVDRRLHLIAEANVYDHELLTHKEFRPAYDGIWSDCLMHSVYSHALPDLSLTHRHYQGAADLVEALQNGYLYYFKENEPHRHTQETREAFQPEDRSSFVTALQTHDAVGNHPAGMRLHQLTSKAYQRASAALMLLYPSIPLIFMGEEAAVATPFPFFVDFEDPALQQAVEEGRAREYPQHVWGSTASPGDSATFQTTRCQQAGTQDPRMRAWYRDLIALRKRGVDEGWLTFDRMTADYNPLQGVFSLRFADDSGGQISVLARLEFPVQDQADRIKISVNGDLLLSSEPDSPIEDGQIDLRPNQAVVIRA